MAGLMGRVLPGWGQSRRKAGRVGRGARGLRPAPPLPPVGAFTQVSRADDVTRFGSALDSFVPMPNQTPFSMLRVYGFLRDAIPDISDAVWTWKRLCQTGYDVEIFDASSGVSERRARRLVEALNQRVNSGDRGMEGLLDVFYTSLFTYGAAAFEIVLSKSRESIWDVVPVDVWTLRFRREDGRLQAYQLREGEEIKLPMDSTIGTTSVGMSAIWFPDSSVSFGGVVRWVGSPAVG